MMMMQFLLFSIKEPDFVDASVDTSDLHSQNTVAIYNYNNYGYKNITT